MLKSQLKKPKSLLKCKRCGNCCVIATPSGFKDCPFLLRYVPLKNAPLTRCMIYPNRLYVINGVNQYCTKRERVPYNYPDCPYNKEGQRLHPKYLNRK